MWLHYNNLTIKSSEIIEKYFCIDSPSMSGRTLRRLSTNIQADLGLYVPWSKSTDCEFLFDLSILFVFSILFPHCCHWLLDTWSWRRRDRSDRLSCCILNIEPLITDTRSNRLQKSIHIISDYSWLENSWFQSLFVSNFTWLTSIIVSPSMKDNMA